MRRRNKWGAAGTERIRVFHSWRTMILFIQIETRP